MKLTDRQAMILWDIAKSAMNIDGGLAGYTSDTINLIVNQILNQQSNIPIELGEIDDVTGYTTVPEHPDNG